jgi:hypothetical protein
MYTDDFELIDGLTIRVDKTLTDLYRRPIGNLNKQLLDDVFTDLDFIRAIIDKYR